DDQLLFERQSADAFDQLDHGRCLVVDRHGGSSPSWLWRLWQMTRPGSRRTTAAAVGAIVAVAAVARFLRLDLMEFKFDEAEACRLALHVLGYSEPGVGRFFPTAGLRSSVGVPNPPLFVYLVAIPLAVVRSPIAVAACVAAANVLAVGLVYL